MTLRQWWRWWAIFDFTVLLVVVSLSVLSYCTYRWATRPDPQICSVPNPEQHPNRKR